MDPVASGSLSLELTFISTFCRLLPPQAPLPCAQMPSRWTSACRCFTDGAESSPVLSPPSLDLGQSRHWLGQWRAWEWSAQPKQAHRACGCPLGETMRTGPGSRRQGVARPSPQSHLIHHSWTLQPQWPTDHTAGPPLPDQLENRRAQPHHPTGPMLPDAPKFGGFLLQ